MSSIPTNQSLFIIDLRYIAPLDDISIHLDEHVTFLEQNYAAGHFIASGPKVPRTGGVIIATAETRTSLEDLLETDPFKMHELARYTVTEFLPSMMVENLKD
ncbi:YciI family protein [uncultured Roseobacter sp.]|uniref:YciI family protein n=1 Tax=uncultured Roseobacter sp. TaxID=114847 RepID=UPI002618AD7B|nr:YciI family protein [uncultured Roseobacter sp.]